VVSLVTIAYTSMGGLQAVVFTDVVQTAIMFLGAILSLVLITISLGGIGATCRMVGRLTNSCRLLPVLLIGARCKCGSYSSEIDPGIGKEPSSLEIASDG